MQFRFEKLEIWRLSIELVDQIYILLTKFPRDERFDLISQIRRAVVSVSLNIAEGSGRSSDKDFSRFIHNSIGSLLEVKAGLIIAGRRKYITRDDYRNVYPLVEKLFFKLHAFNKSLA